MPRLRPEQQIGPSSKDLLQVVGGSCRGEWESGGSTFALTAKLTPSTESPERGIPTCRQRDHFVKKIPQPAESADVGPNRQGHFAAAACACRARRVHVLGWRAQCGGADIQRGR